MKMHSCWVWFAVVVAVMYADAVAGNEDKLKGQQLQQQSDVMQTLANGGSDDGSIGHVQSAQTPAGGYYADTSRPFGSYNIAKRAQHNKQYGFGLGKRLYRQYEFGLGKRSASKQYGFGLGKRAAAEQYQFGLGKRVAPTFYNFGLGRRASPQYSFGLGKRMSRPSFLNVDEKEADYTYNDLSEEKKRTTDDMMSMGHGQRFAFGLGKRAAADWDDGGGVDDDGDLALAVPIWHPAVRRARLQYGFGLGKRADDYDGGEYASDPQPDDDATAIDLN